MKYGAHILNHASQRVAHKLGFVFEGTERMAYIASDGNLGSRGQRVESIVV